MTKESKEQKANMNPESESTYFCRVWTLPYSLIIRNSAGNPIPSDIRCHHLWRKEKTLSALGQMEW